MSQVNKMIASARAQVDDMENRALQAPQETERWDKWALQ
jgi:hypothetical protein